MLSETSGSDHVRLNVTKSQLAAYLGTIPETISRVLRKFADSDILEVAGSQVTILDKNTLEAIATGLERL